MGERDRSAERRIEQWPQVASLLPGVICSQCGATTANYAEKCSADPSEVCHGFLAVQGAYQHIALSSPEREDG